MNQKFFLKCAGIVILVGVALVSIGYMYKNVQVYNTIFAQNIFIEDVPVGGLTKEEAKAKLEQLVEEHMKNRYVVLVEDTNEVKIPLNDFGISYNVNEVINQAFDDCHNVGFFRKNHLYKHGLPEKHRYYLSKLLDEAEIDTQLKACQENFYTAPINATYKRVNGEFVTVKEKAGSELHFATTRQRILEVFQDLPDTEIITINIDTKPVLAQYTEKDFENSKTLVASFSTSYNNANANRNENLKVAAQKINGALLPDEIFYLSEHLEPFTEEAGYKRAATIVNGKIEDSLGGGICQVSSTLYNALLLTDLEIVYRQNHSLAVAYVPLGRDATYNTGSIDFKFKNNTKYPLYVEAYCQDNHVYVNIYGHPSLKSEYTIKFESVVTEVIPAPEAQYKKDAELYVGQEVVEVFAIDGKTVNLYKLLYKDDELVDKILVNKSYYRPRGAIIRTGTKPLPEPESTEEAPENAVPDLNEINLMGNMTTPNTTSENTAA